MDIEDFFVLGPQLLPLLPDIKRAIATAQKLMNDPDIKAAIATASKLATIIENYEKQKGDST